MQIEEEQKIRKEYGCFKKRLDFEEQIIRHEEIILQMDYAYGWANRMSYAIRRKVGAVLYKNRTPISCGYNGTSSGEDNCCEFEDLSGNLITKDNVIHAEANTLDKLAAFGSVTGAHNASIFTTTAPCMSCAIRIKNVLISTVYFTEIYRSVSGIEHLIKHGITVNHVDLVTEEVTTIYQAKEDNDIDNKIASIKKIREMFDSYADGIFHFPQVTTISTRK